ncbi:Protein CBG02082 [Caenorhabditis briggsae]|uniref:Protein CBG02082 n=2 Tax=Caenorhabditis briggsae TaxID=6238 RepID=A8WRY3_CAEBR|nr:Protein CBG02082 [Caenorhabditis briggsae]ULT80652.1 hypothetical protein L3Y34_010895 [Caenorhabditis briggsae]CAP23241.2 Protein CBG02082 [Caenorhabditis briggsae]
MSDPHWSLPHCTAHNDIRPHNMVNWDREKSSQWKLTANMDWFQRQIDEDNFLKMHEFHHDTILQRLPDGMEKGEDIDTHIIKCTRKFDEVHVFESKELAERFAKIRCPGFKLDTSNEEDKDCCFRCPLGREFCTAYYRIHKETYCNSHVLQVSFCHYDHDRKEGQQRFTTLEYALIRLFVDFFWKTEVSPEWNAHNMVYCFRHWFSLDHPLRYMTIYDVKAIGLEIGKLEVAQIDMLYGVYHSERSTVESRNASGTIQGIEAVKMAAEHAYRPTDINHYCKELPYMNQCTDTIGAPNRVNVWFLWTERDFLTAVQAWEELALYTARFRDYLQTLKGGHSTSYVNEIAEFVDHFYHTAQNMVCKIKTMALCNPSVSSTYTGESETMFEMEEPLFPNLPPSKYPDFYFPLKKREDGDCIKVGFSAALFPLLVVDDTMCLAIRDDACLAIQGGSSDEYHPEVDRANKIAQIDDEEFADLVNGIRQGAPITIQPRFVAEVSDLWRNIFHREQYSWTNLGPEPAPTVATCSPENAQTPAVATTAADNAIEAENSENLPPLTKNQKKKQKQKEKKKQAWAEQQELKKQLVTEQID